MHSPSHGLLNRACEPYSAVAAFRHSNAARKRCKWAFAALDGESEGFPYQNDNLANTIRRKREQLSNTLKEFSGEDLYTRLGGAEFGQLSQQGPLHRFTGLIPEVRFRDGRPALVLELSKPSPATTSSELADLAREYEAGGADALAVPTDAADTSTGLADLLSVCRAVKCPVVRRDWILHPIQIREAKEAGAAGVMGIVVSVLSQKAALLSSYAATLGLDCPVEIVNAGELAQMETLGIPFFGCNLGVGLSLAVPGFRSDIAAGILDRIPFGASSIVGVTSMEEAVKARDARADMVFVKKEWIAKALAAGPSDSTTLPLSAEHNYERGSGLPRRTVGQNSKHAGAISQHTIKSFIEELRYATSGDD